MWNAAQYLKYSDERSRPFVDLLSQVRCQSPRRIVDFGCGVGHLTRTLLERWPDASVIGVDNSPEMLEKASAIAEPGRLEFQRADIAEWCAPEKFDLIVSNAALHWLDDHSTVLTRWSNLLAANGTLAVQMPNRFQTPTQLAIEEAVSDLRWTKKLEGVGLHRESVKPTLWYVHLLQDLGLSVNAWETTYIHVLTGDNPVLEWLKGTGLRPLLERLEFAEQADFLTVVGRRLKEFYPERNGVTVLPMPRLFVVASR